MVETERAYAFVAGRIRAEWIEKAAGGLVRRTYFDAHWDARRAEPMVFEQVALYGLTLIARRRVRFAPVSREGAREVSCGPGSWRTDTRVLTPSSSAMRRSWPGFATRSTSLRSPGAMVSDDAVFAFYDTRIPSGVVDGRSFEEWFSGLDEDGARKLELHREDIAPGARLAGEAEYPDVLRVDDRAFGLAYRFAPGEDDDGLTLTIPIDVLVDLDPGRFEWLVPGMLDAKVLALLRALPKSLRRTVMPLAGVAREFIAGTRARDGSLREALARFLDGTRGVCVPRDAWSPARLRRVLPAHLLMRFEITDRDGAVLGRSRRLDEIERRLVGRPGREGVVVPGRGEHGYTSWTFGAVPVEAEDRAGGTSGVVVRDEGRAGGRSDVVFEAEDRLGDGSGVVFSGAARRRVGGGCGALSGARRRRAQPPRRTRAAVLARHAARSPGVSARTSRHRRAVPALRDDRVSPDWVDPPREHAGRPGHGTFAEARRDLIDRTVARVFVAPTGAIRERSRFEAALAAGRGEFAGGLAASVDAGLAILRAARTIRQLIDAPDMHAPPESLADAQRQLDGLVHHGFLATTPERAFESLPRYLEALRVRLEKLRRGGANDTRRLADILPLQQRLESKFRDIRARGRRDAELARHRWLLEEYRVSVFAQELGTAFSVSREKARRAMVPDRGALSRHDPWRRHVMRIVGPRSWESMRSASERSAPWAGR